jgi:predicted DNA-binding transcriptional regulator AlpA
MALYSTRQAAKKLCIGVSTLSQYISRKKIPAPTTVKIGDLEVHSWTDEDIEHVRKLLPKIANGRKTRYHKTKENQKPPAGAPVPHKSRKPKKKK